MLTALFLSKYVISRTYLLVTNNLTHYFLSLRHLLLVVPWFTMSLISVIVFFALTPLQILRSKYFYRCFNPIWMPEPFTKCLSVVVSIEDRRSLSWKFLFLFYVMPYNIRLLFFFSPNCQHYSEQGRWKFFRCEIFLRKWY